MFMNNQNPRLFQPAGREVRKRLRYGAGFSILTRSQLLWIHRERTSLFIRRFVLVSSGHFFTLRVVFVFFF